MSSRHGGGMMSSGGSVVGSEVLLAEPIRLTELVREAAATAESFKQECHELNQEVQGLARLLRAAARFCIHGGALYSRPAARIATEACRSLEAALSLTRKCHCRRTGALSRFITILSVADFRRARQAVESSTADMKWILNVSRAGDNPSVVMQGMPPIANSDPMLAWIWGDIARLLGGAGADEQEEAAGDLASLARDNERNGKIIIEEEGVPPLLALLKDAHNPHLQLAAASALSNLALDSDRVDQMLEWNVIPTFIHVLATTNVPMKTQARVAAIIAKMAALSPHAKTEFGAYTIIRPLVFLLVFETLDESDLQRHKSLASIVHQTATGPPPSVATTQESTGDEKHRTLTRNKTQKSLFVTIDSPNESNQSNSRNSRDLYNSSSFAKVLRKKKREHEDPATKSELRLEVTHALWRLAESSIANSRKITETRALLCFAKLIETSDGDIQWHSIMAVMEIAAAAEQNVDLRRFAFKTNSPAVKALIDQFLRVINEDTPPQLKVPCVKSIGYLSRIFPARETRVIKSLISHLSSDDNALTAESVISLVKFIEEENYLHKEHSRTIIEEASALSDLVQLAFLPGRGVQINAILAVSYLALHMGKDEIFLETSALQVLKTVESSNLSQLKTIEGYTLSQLHAVYNLLHRAIQHLELYQATGHSPHPLYYY